MAVSAGQRQRQSTNRVTTPAVAGATGAATVTVEPDDRLSPGTGWDCYAWWPGARSELIATGPSEAAAIAAAVIAAADEPVGAPRHA